MRRYRKKLDNIGHFIKWMFLQLFCNQKIKKPVLIPISSDNPLFHLIKIVGESFSGLDQVQSIAMLAI